MSTAVSETLTSNYEAQLLELRTNEPVTSRNFIAQVALLCVATVVGWLVLDLWQLPLWFFAYYALIAAEKYLVLRLPTSLSRAGYAALLFFLMFNASVYCSLPIFLWHQDGDILKLGTLALVTGSTLNSFLTRARYASILAGYLIPNASVFLFISWSVFLEFGWSGEFLASAVAAGAIATYFTIGLLEAHTKERAAAETRMQLQKAQRLEVIGRLTGGISHDFNNLLSVISGSLQLLRETTDAQKRDQLIHQALVASEQGSDLTKRMLAFGQQAPLSPMVVDTVEVLENLRPLLSRLIPASVGVSIEVAPDTPPILVDPSMLQSALINLALNASAAMPNGGTLSITAKKAKSAGDKINGIMGSNGSVEIRVEDNGAGITADDLERIFEPFTKTREIGEGSGLGLPMVKGFVEQSGGRLELTSAAGEGTQISILLPIADVRHGGTRTESPIKTASTGSATVLIADDNLQLLQLIALKLTHDGHTVWTAESGEQALAMLMEGKIPDLILTDVIMPGDVQGSDLVAYSKQNNPNVPIIVMSGYAETGSATGAGIKEADFFMEKPLQLSELSSKINALLAAS